MLCVIADITDRKLAEQQLIEHHDMLGAIIENFPGGVSMFDTHLRLTAHNQRFRQLLDFPDALLDNPELSYQDLIRFNAQRGEYGPCDVEQYVAASVTRALQFEPHKFERVRPNGVVLEIHGQPVPGGFETIYIDITERKKIEAQVHQLAFYDPLTRLPNRRMLGDRLNQTMALSKRSARYAAIMILDLDNFKALNDTLGHAVGDLLLQQAAKRMKACVREVDTVARLGGDEFVVLLGDLDTDKAASTTQANSIAEKIRAALAEPYSLTIKHEGKADAVIEHQCTASIGVVVFIDNEGSPEDFLKWADSAMYRAKDAGSNLIRFFDLNA
ncbi:putative diguanylate cyclase YcdT [mine drainage metagenome]|uniref:Putative diguanylate cyclase YcdT n=1 Tax=mine drainage metagenome TaxID=410659 RepID=A0A1J5PLI7_9ZZZZ